MATGKVIKGEISAEPAKEVSPSPLRQSRGGGGVLEGQVYEAHQSARRIVELAQKQAQEILDQANRETERIISEAREMGRQQGLADVSEQILRAKIVHGEKLASSEREIVALALKVAEKILGRDLERDPSLVVDLCARAIEDVRSAHQVIVRVNPKDALHLREQRGRMMERVGRVKEIAIKEDPEVGRHGCIIETEVGIIDAQLATQLEVLREVLLRETRDAEGLA
jgi:type III secretion protein L